MEQILSATREYRRPRVYLPVGSPLSVPFKCGCEAPGYEFECRVGALCCNKILQQHGANSFLAWPLSPAPGQRRSGSHMGTFVRQRVGASSPEPAGKARIWLWPGKVREAAGGAIGRSLSESPHVYLTKLIQESTYHRLGEVLDSRQTGSRHTGQLSKLRQMHVATDKCSRHTGGWQMQKMHRATGKCRQTHTMSGKCRQTHTTTGDCRGIWPLANAEKAAWQMQHRRRVSTAERAEKAGECREKTEGEWRMQRHSRRLANTEEAGECSERETGPLEHAHTHQTAGTRKDTRETAGTRKNVHRTAGTTRKDMILLANATMRMICTLRIMTWWCTIIIIMEAS